MSGLTIGLVLFTQYIFVSPKNPCRAMEVDIARAAHEVFLDPTDEKRAEMTRRVSESVLLVAARRKYVDGCELGMPDGARDATALRCIWSFADDSSLPSAYRRGFDDFYDHHPRSSSRAHLQSLTHDAQKACAGGIGTGGCTPDRLWFLVLLDDPIASPLFRPSSPNSALPNYWLRPEVQSDMREEVPIWIERSAIPIWIALRRQFPQRSEFLRAALRSSDFAVRELALDEAVGDVDPRNWKPDDVAVLILEARKADAEASEIEELRKKDPVRGALSSHPPDSEPSQREGQILYRLRKMGFRRVFALVHPREQDAPQQKGLEPTAGRPASPEHFVGEQSLCIADWLARNPKVDATRLYANDPTIRDQLVADCHLRWIETDEAAPHPDLERIRAAMKRLETTKP